MSTASNDDQQSINSQTDMPLGLRLRHARTSKGMTVSEVAEKLRLKSATVEALEREDLDALGAPVYVRGYFSSYARLVDVPVVLVDRTFAQRVEVAPIPLSSPARTSHSRYLFDRYAKRAVYVVLTASIVVPVILLATRDQLPRPGATLTPLDSPMQIEAGPGGESARASTRDSGNTGSDSTSPALPAPTVEPRSAAENPVIASLTPFYPAATAPTPIVPPEVIEDSGLSLHFSGDSWVEIIGRDGSRLEYGMVRAGTIRRFDANNVARVSLGNASAVEVRMNGAVTDIAAFRRANVARFTVSSQGSLAPAGG
jgi:cytoskeleton protein RodZ